MKVDPEKLKALRKASGWSQSQLARASGVSVETIQGVEQSTHHEQLRRTVVQLARALNVEVADLLIDGGGSGTITLTAEDKYLYPVVVIARTLPQSDRANLLLYAKFLQQRVKK